jgi:hypothetical protein
VFTVRDGVFAKKIRGKTPDKGGIVYATVRYVVPYFVCYFHPVTLEVTGLIHDARMRILLVSGRMTSVTYAYLLQETRKQKHGNLKPYIST